MMSDLQTIKRRNEKFFQARSLMILAFYREMSENSRSDIERNTAYQTAVETVDHYISLYNTPERIYHTPQHALVQILPLSMAQKSILLNKCPPELSNWKEAEAVINKIKMKKRLPNGPKWDATLLPISTKSMDYFWQYLRDQIRHDCLYYLPKFVDKEGAYTIQTQLHAQIKEAKPALTLQDILSPQTAKKTFIAKNADNILELKPQVQVVETIEGISIGELAAICAFPDGQGGYDKTKSFEGFKAGLNEWASAVYAVQMEQEKRAKAGIKPLTMQEILQTCLTLAATIPFQEKEYLNNMAKNIAAFLEKNASNTLRNQLGIFGQGDKSKRETYHMVNKMMVNAAKFSGQDTRNFRRGGIGLYDGDRAMTCELLGLRDNQKSPFNQFFIAWKSYVDQATEKDIQRFDPSAKGDGFIRQQLIGRRVWHCFHPLLTKGMVGDVNLRVAERKVNRLHNKLEKNAAIMLEWHCYDMAKQVANIAQAVNSPIQLENDVPHKEAESYSASSKGLRELRGYSNAIFESDFWNSYGALLRHGGIKDMQNFSAVKKVIDLLESKHSSGMSAPSHELKKNVLKSVLSPKTIEVSTVEALKIALSSSAKEKFGDALDDVIQVKQSHATQKVSGRG